MYPIEREDYVNAYIAAISDEMRQARHTQQAGEAASGAFDRLHGIVAGLLKRGATGTHQTTNPLPNS
ncbi:MAG: hypothetical protein ABFR89_13090 [Actinomycetota bacterium]